MSWLKRIFKRTNGAPTIARSPFSVEHYPLTGKYLAKHKAHYLHRNHITGIIEELEPYLFSYADKFLTIEAAKQCIELFKEQQLKENVKTYEA